MVRLNGWFCMVRLYGWFVWDDFLVLCRRFSILNSEYKIHLSHNTHDVTHDDT